MDFVILFILTGLLYQGPKALECYDCENCRGGHGEVDDCSELSSTSCYLTQVISTGVVAKSCGIDIGGMDVFGLSIGCKIEGGSILCRCTTNLCNTVDLLPSTITTTTTTTTVSTTSHAPASTTSTSPPGNSVATTTPSGTGFECYQCINCGSSVGVLTDCSEFSTSRNCYLLQKPDGSVNKVCGTKELDDSNPPLGCVSVGDYRVCKCSESSCNEYSEFVQTTATRRLPPDTPSTTPPTDGRQPSSTSQSVASNQPTTSRQSTTTRQSSSTSESSTTRQSFTTSHSPATTSTTRTSSTTTVPPATISTELTTATVVQQPSQWLCYVCVNCMGSVGTLTDCSTTGTSKSCLLTVSASGTVSRTCGQELFNETPDGCNTNQGATICKCSEYACNNYPQYLDPSTTPAIWSCYTCIDCGATFGEIMTCSGSTSCSLTIKNKIVTRSCGSDELDLLVPEAEGCKTTEDGTHICKCSKRRCNLFIIEAADILESAAQSGNNYKPTKLLVFSVAICLLTII